MIRLAILDDNAFVRGPDGAVRPASATFNRFAETVVARGPFGRADYLIPVGDQRTGDPPPGGGPVDEDRLRIVPTTAFGGIAHYLATAPRLLARNWPIIRDAVDRADLVWIKAPASNAPLAAIACRRSGVPRFTWVAGSVREVIRGQHRSGLLGAAAFGAAIVYDASTRWLERTGPVVRLDNDLFSNVVSAADMQASEAALREVTDPGPSNGSIRLVWAGRVAAEKGLDDLLEAMARLRAANRRVDLQVIGDGPRRVALEGRAASLGLDGSVHWRGHIGDRRAYLSALREADIFVLPSRAEGLPKVLLEAMSTGLPVIATRVGAIPTLLDGGRLGRLVPPARPDALADAIVALAADAAARATLRRSGLAFAAEHTAEAQADRLVDWMRRTFPDLAWHDGAAR